MEAVELELRAWHEPTKRMYNVTTISFVKQQVFGRSQDGLNISDGILTFALMRFTGLTDKRGRKIFEGDIMVNDNYHSYGIVMFKPGIFVMAYPDTFIQLSNPRVTVTQRMDLEIVGNVYQNIDLLKGGERMDEQTQAQPTAEEQVQAPVEAEAQPAEVAAEAPAEAVQGEPTQTEQPAEVQAEAPAAPAEETALTSETPAEEAAPAEAEVAKAEENATVVVKVTIEASKVKEIVAHLTEAVKLLESLEAEQA